MKRISATLLLALADSLSIGRAQQITPVIDSGNPLNTAAQQAKHYVILVSLDGFRYDYPTKYGAPHLQARAADGASAPNGMLPSYPSLTFPNHLSLVTGLILRTTASSRTASTIPSETIPTSTRSRRRMATEPVTAARRSGRWRSSRGCDRPAFSGPAPRRRSLASGHPTI